MTPSNRGSGSGEAGVAGSLPNFRRLAKGREAFVSQTEYGGAETQSFHTACPRRLQSVRLEPGLDNAGQEGHERLYAMPLLFAGGGIFCQTSRGEGNGLVGQFKRGSAGGSP